MPGRSSIAVIPTPDSMFDARAYPKGAWVLHMLRKQLGEDVFWNGIRTYGNENRYKSVETERLPQGDGAGQRPEPGTILLRLDRTAGAPGAERRRRRTCRTRKQVRVEVKQTQAGEAFHFPLPIATAVGPTASPTKRLLRHRTAEPGRAGHGKGAGLFLQRRRPDRGLIVVDPDLTVFCEMTEEKGRDLWVKQLADAPTAAARMTAAAHFGKSKQANDQEALAAAFKAEKFWGVQVRIAEALGETGGDICRAALIDGLKQADARVRRACVKALAGYRKDATATAALKAKLKDGDPSVEVEAGLLRAYAHVAAAGRGRRGDALPGQAVAAGGNSRRRPSTGSAASQDLSVVDTLDRAGRRRGKPPRVRGDGDGRPRRAGQDRQPERRSAARRSPPPSPPAWTTRAGGCGRRPCGRCGSWASRPPYRCRPWKRSSTTTRTAGCGRRPPRRSRRSAPTARPRSSSTRLREELDKLKIGQRRPARTARPLRAEVEEEINHRGTEDTEKKDNSKDEHKNTPRSQALPGNACFEAPPRVFKPRGGASKQCVPRQSLGTREELAGLLV